MKIEKSQIETAISQAVSRAFENFSGPATEHGLIELAVNQIPEDFDPSDLLTIAIAGEVKHQKRLRSLEKHDEGEGDLFPESLHEKLMTYEENNNRYVIKFRDSQLKHHLQFREKQIRNIRRQNKSFEIWEQRRDIALPIMQENPELTMEQVLEFVIEDA